MIVGLGALAVLGDVCRQQWHGALQDRFLPSLGKIEDLPFFSSIGKRKRKANVLPVYSLFFVVPGLRRLTPGAHSACENWMDRAGHSSGNAHAFVPSCGLLPSY
jgi:hypothetical protein